MRGVGFGNATVAADGLQSNRRCDERGKTLAVTTMPPFAPAAISPETTSPPD